MNNLENIFKQRITNDDDRRVAMSYLKGYSVGNLSFTGFNLPQWNDDELDILVDHFGKGISLKYRLDSLTSFLDKDDLICLFKGDRGYQRLCSMDFVFQPYTKHFFRDLILSMHPEYPVNHSVVSFRTHLSIPAAIQSLRALVMNDAKMHNMRDLFFEQLTALTRFKAITPLQYGAIQFYCTILCSQGFLTNVPKFRCTGIRNKKKEYKVPDLFFLTTLRAAKNLSKDMRACFDTYQGLHGTLNDTTTFEDVCMYYTTQNQPLEEVDLL